MRVLDRSLSWLKGRFPDIPTMVVYIPSPASIYRFATDEVVTSQGRSQNLSASVAQIAKRSDLICDLARDAGLRLLQMHQTARERRSHAGMDVVDTSSIIIAGK
jgi:hypothetical protein